MTTIQFKLENQLLTRLDTTTLMNKSKHIIRAKFSITGEVWDNVTDYFVSFTDSWDEETVMHLGEDYTCTVPSSCLDGSFFKISVYASDLITTNVITIPLMDSGYNKAHNIHQGCNKPNTDIFVEIFERLHFKIDDIICADHCLHLFSDGRLINTVSLPFLDTSQVMSIVLESLEEYTKTDELEGFLKEHGYINHVYMEGDEIIFE